MKYYVASGDTLSELEADVNANLKVGWQLHGSMLFQHCLMQPMVLEEEQTQETESKTLGQGNFGADLTT